MISNFDDYLSGTDLNRFTARHMKQVIYVRCMEAHHRERCEGRRWNCRGLLKRTVMNPCNGNFMLKFSRQEQQRLGNAPLER